MVGCWQEEESGKTWTRARPTVCFTWAPLELNDDVARIETVVLCALVFKWSTHSPHYVKLEIGLEPKWNDHYKLASSYNWIVHNNILLHDQQHNAAAIRRIDLPAKGVCSSETSWIAIR